MLSVDARVPRVSAPHWLTPGCAIGCASCNATSPGSQTEDGGGGEEFHPDSEAANIRSRSAIPSRAFCSLSGLRRSGIPRLTSNSFTPSKAEADPAKGDSLFASDRSSPIRCRPESVGRPRGHIPNEFRATTN